MNKCFRSNQLGRCSCSCKWGRGRGVGLVIIVSRESDLNFLGLSLGIITIGVIAGIEVKLSGYVV